MLIYIHIFTRLMLSTRNISVEPRNESANYDRQISGSNGSGLQTILGFLEVDVFITCFKLYEPKLTMNQISKIS